MTAAMATTIIPSGLTLFISSSSIQRPRRSGGTLHLWDDASDPLLGLPLSEREQLIPQGLGVV